MPQEDAFAVAERELAKALHREHPFLKQEDGSTDDYIDGLKEATQKEKESPHDHH